MKLQLDERMRTSVRFRQLMQFVEDLSLDDNDDDPSYPDNDGPPRYPGKDTVDVVTDYLTCIREHAWGHLERVYGTTFFNSMKKDLVVTVPAVWSERAKDLTMNAVAAAEFGADKTWLVTEPEAAAIYTLKCMSEGPLRGDLGVSLMKLIGPSQSAS